MYVALKNAYGLLVLGNIYLVTYTTKGDLVVKDWLPWVSLGYEIRPVFDLFFGGEKKRREACREKKDGGFASEDYDGFSWREEEVSFFFFFFWLRGGRVWVFVWRVVPYMGGSRGEGLSIFFFFGECAFLGR